MKKTIYLFVILNWIVIYTISAEFSNKISNTLSRISQNPDAITKMTGLGYYSDPDDNLFDFFHLKDIPDSIYGYEGGSPTNSSIILRFYYTFNDNVLSIVNKNQGLTYAYDTIIYNENGNIDSAILETEADWEYDEYTVKHVYKYENSLMKTEWVYIDLTNDNIHNDWALRRIINYSYDESNRLVEKLTKSVYEDQASDFLRNSYQYELITGGYYIRNDSNFITFPGEPWYPTDIAYNYLYPNLQCFNYQDYTFAPSSYLKPDSFGIPSIYKINDKEYDSTGNLKNESIRMYNFGTAIYSKKEYEYNSDGTRQSKTIYNKDNSWYIYYKYQYYYSPHTTQIKENTLQDLKIFPNPADHNLFIDGITKGSRVEIYSIDGKFIRAVNYNNSISIADLPKGIYLIRLPEISTGCLKLLKN